MAAAPPPPAPSQLAAATPTDAVALHPTPEEPPPSKKRTRNMRRHTAKTAKREAHTTQPHLIPEEAARPNPVHAVRSTMRALAVEHATGHADISAAMLAADQSAAADQPAQLTDEWLPVNAPPAQARIASFTDDDFPHAILPKDHLEVVERINAIDEALFHLDLIAAGKVLPRVAADPEAHINSIIALMPNPDDFTAGGLTRYYYVWEHLLGPYRRARRNVKWILNVIKEGVRWDMVAPFSQSGMPDFKTKAARVQKMIAKQLGAEAATRLMHSSEPAYLQFPNHQSAQEHPEFTKASLAEACTRGYARKLPKGVVPHTTASLGVAANKPQKLRQIIDPAYINLLLKYMPLRYEQLTDVPHYAQPGDWATTTDEKSGYYHIPLHPSMWTHFGVCWEGEYYVFTHMAFGIGPACRTYTILKTELFRVLRERGSVRMTFLIDDQCNLAKTKEMAYFQAAAILMMQWALGFTLSLTKCQLTPTQTPHFLGMRIHLAEQCFVLPPEKIAEFRQAVVALVAGRTLTARCLASLAGKLISFAPAIGLAPLYAHQLYKIMQGMPVWDVHCPSPRAALDTMRWVADHLDTWNGHRWFPSRAVVRMAGDYSSERGFGAYLLDKTLLPDPIVVPLSEAEQLAIRANTYSSTYGELKALDYSLDVLTSRQLVHLVAGKTLCYEGDNFGFVCNVTGMKGNARNYPLVRAIHEKARAADIHLAVEWHPRSAPNQDEADALSKLVDNSEWVLNGHVFIEHIVQHPLVMAHPAGGITIDLAASNRNTKSPRFMSRAWCPGTEGVNMFTRVTWAVHPVTGQRELCFINGDFSLMGPILAKVLRDRADCVIVYPDWPRYWQVLWADIKPKAVFSLPRLPDLCVPSSRVDATKGRGRPPSYTIKVAVVIWE